VTVAGSVTNNGRWILNGNQQSQFSHSSQTTSLTGAITMAVNLAKFPTMNAAPAAPLPSIWMWPVH
jgi:hypothetical protein